MNKVAISLLCLFVVPKIALADVTPVGFPKTIADVSFEDRVAVMAEGYKPFMDKSVYKSLDIAEGEEIYTDHMIATIEDYENNNTTTPVVAPTPAPTTDIQPTPFNPLPTQPAVQYNTYTVNDGTVIENNIVTDGACYPPAKDTNFTNKILTTGKYERISPAFEKAMITVFRKEGGCGTIKNDPCGYTCYGIGSSPKCSGVVVKTRAEAEDFYYTRFWKKYNYGKLPDVISGDIFLASMASGPVTAIRQFSTFLGLPKSNSITPEMISAVQNYNGDIHNRWLDKRDEFLQKVARERYNGSVSRGYTNAIILKRKNGCHVRPVEVLTR